MGPAEMSPELVRRFVQYSWCLLTLVWFIGALRAKPHLRTQPLVPRIVHAVLLLVGFFLLFTSAMDIGILGRRFLARYPAIEELGLVLTFTGIAFAIWARFFLGTNWSAAPAIKRGHQLIRSGPYAIVRHPIYSGLLLAMLGTALAIGKWRTLVGLTVVAFAWHIKSRTEERYMQEEFGDEYARYRGQVKGLIPFVR